MSVNSMCGRYISVLTKALTSGTLTFHIKSTNWDSAINPPTIDSQIDYYDPITPGPPDPYVYPIDIPVNVSIVAGMKESDIAAAIVSAMNTTFFNAVNPNNNTNQFYLYNGVPAFYAEYVPFTFRVIVCDHIIHIWSQQMFTVELTTNNDSEALDNSPDVEEKQNLGIICYIAETPVYTTIQEAYNFAPAFSVDFVNRRGQEFTKTQLVNILAAASQQLVSYMDSPAVLTTYLHTEPGNYSDGFMLDETPVVTWDNPFVRGPKILNATGLNGIQLTSDYELERDTGCIKFAGSSIIPYYITPLDYDNILKMTYAAGLQSVHPILKQETVRVVGFNTQPLHYESLKVGSTSVKFKDPSDVITLIQSNLRRVLGR